jgi:hypothetical protein
MIVDDPVHAKNINIYLHKQFHEFNPVTHRRQLHPLHYR